MKVRKLYFTDCHLAGRKYHDADEVWSDLKVGTILQMERDSSNKYDPNAVAVTYRKEGEKEPYIIGYIPRLENVLIANLLDMGWAEIFECRVSKVDETAHPEQQVQLTIKIKRNMNNGKERN